MLTIAPPFNMQNTILYLIFARLDRVLSRALFHVLSRFWSDGARDPPGSSNDGLLDMSDEGTQHGMISEAVLGEVTVEERTEELTLTVHPRKVLNRRAAERQRRAIRRTGEVFQELFDRFDLEELAEIAEGVEDAINVPLEEGERARFVREFAEAPRYLPDERLALRIKTLSRSFALRKELVKESLTAPEVARLLGVSRQDSPRPRRERQSARRARPGILAFPDLAVRRERSGRRCRGLAGGDSSDADRAGNCEDQLVRPLQSLFGWATSD